MASKISTWFYQLIRFGLVGGIAALVHFGFTLLLIKYFSLAPLWANTWGFLLAFNISYFGHRYITFSQTQASHRQAASRLFLMGAINFVVNQVLFGSLLYVAHLNPIIALLLSILLVPVSTFLLSKYWVFRI